MCLNLIKNCNKILLHKTKFNTPFEILIIMAIEVHDIEDSDDSEVFTADECKELEEDLKGLGYI